MRLETGRARKVQTCGMTTASRPRGGRGSFGQGESAKLHFPLSRDLTAVAQTPRKPRNDSACQVVLRYYAVAVLSNIRFSDIRIRFSNVAKTSNFEYEVSYANNKRQKEVYLAKKVDGQMIFFKKTRYFWCKKKEKNYFPLKGRNTTNPNSNIRSSIRISRNEFLGWNIRFAEYEYSSVENTGTMEIKSNSSNCSVRETSLGKARHRKCPPRFQPAPPTCPSRGWREYFQTCSKT